MIEMICSKIKQAPDNFIISPYVPQSEILSEANVFITHGGMNSVHDTIMQCPICDNTA